LQSAKKPRARIPTIAVLARHKSPENKGFDPFLAIEKTGLDPPEQFTYSPRLTHETRPLERATNALSTTGFRVHVDFRALGICLPPNHLRVRRSCRVIPISRSDAALRSQLRVRKGSPSFKPNEPRGLIRTLTFVAPEADLEAVSVCKDAGGTLRYLDHRRRKPTKRENTIAKDRIVGSNRSRKLSQGVLCPPGTRPFPGAFFFARRYRASARRFTSTPRMLTSGRASYRQPAISPRTTILPVDGDRLRHPGSPSRITAPSKGTAA
jgi:hypothetical protein